MARVGLVVNPAAGRDIRRLTGGANVVDNYTKRRVAACVLDGLTLVDDPPDVCVMPDRAGIADHALQRAPASVEVERVDIPIRETAVDTRRAVAEFRAHTDVVVVLGGDGTNRDAALELGELPLVSVSTGTNNVVPSPIDGTVAGAVAAVVANRLVEVEAVSTRHGMVRARANDVNGEKRVTGLAAIEVTDRPFVGGRAVVDPSELLGGVVSRAHPAELGLNGVVGCVEPVAPDEPGGAAVRLGDPETASRTVRAVIAPGMTATVGVEEHRRLDWGESVTVAVEEGVIGADGERELELVNASAEITPVRDGPRVVNPAATLEMAAKSGLLVRDGVPGGE